MSDRAWGYIGILFLALAFAAGFAVRGFVHSGPRFTLATKMGYAQALYFDHKTGQLCDADAAQTFDEFGHPSCKSLLKY
jgi:hypothetical protein